MVKNYLQKGEGKNVRYAILRKRKKKLFESSINPGLELLVGNASPNVLEMKEKVLGHIRFESPLKPEEIIEDFKTKYSYSLCNHFLGEKSISRLSYPYSFEPTITQAFVDYFSNLKS